MSKRTRSSNLPEETGMEDVLQQLDELEDTVDSAEEQKELNDVRIALERLPDTVSKRIEKYTTRDIAEGFVGSIIISLPLLVEDGVYDIGAHFVENTVMGVPVWLVGNITFIVVMTWALLYWADFRDVAEPNPFFGTIPRRLVGVLLISLFTSSLLMTLWGRVEGWEDPLVAFARISVIWTAAAFGAVIGDILPGQSSGTELREVSKEVNETLRSDD